MLRSPLLQLLFFPFFLIGLQHSLSAQVLFGKVMDVQGTPIPSVVLRDTVFQVYGLTDSNGFYKMPVREGSAVALSCIGFETQYAAFNFTLEKSDTLYQNFVLKESTNELGTARISSNRVKTVVKQDMTNIVDYIPYKEFVLVLKSHKRRRFLSLEGIDKTYRNFDLGKIKGRQLQEDCFGNVHVLTKDSAYQVWTDTELHVVDKCSIKHFNENIAPCVASFEANVIMNTEKGVTFFEDYLRENKLYQLAAANQKDVGRVIYSLWDKMGEKVARQEKRIIMGMYSGQIDEENNIITNGAWNGDVVSLWIPGDFELMQRISWYKNVSSAPVRASSLQHADKVSAFDLFTDSIHTFNDEGKLINKTGFLKPKKKNAQEIIVDKANHTCYLLDTKKATHRLYKINTENGSTEEVFHLEESPFAQDVQVFDDWVYFRYREGNFYRLFRAKI